MNLEYLLADSVLFRLIQIFQEAMLLGIDGADLMRQIRLRISDEDCNVLELSPEYVKQIDEWHKKLVEEAEAMKAAQANAKVFVS